MADECDSAMQGWWKTELIEIQPGVIRIRGYDIEDLIGRVSFVDQLWLMLRGELPLPGHAKLLEAALVGCVDHGPQAPSIATARMAMTCGVGINNAMASGINALGDVHGGAGQQAMELYQNALQMTKEGLAREEAARRIVDERLASGHLIEGFGHRFHPVDPRAPRLLSLVDEAAASGIVDGTFAKIARAIEEALSARKNRHVPMNIDGASAVIFSELGFPPVVGRGLFVLSRSVGIMAHAWEQACEGGRIKGPMPPSVPYTFAGHPKRRLDGRS